MLDEFKVYKGVQMVNPLRVKKSAQTILIALAAFLLPMSGWAKTYFVSLSGNDNNAGTSAAPFATLLKGVSVMAPGDTLRVRQGRYQQRLYVPLSGTVSAPLTIKADEGVTLVDAINRQNIRVTGSNVNISGFKVSDSPLDCVLVEAGASNVVLSGLEVSNCRYHGVHIMGSNITVENTKVTNASLVHEDEKALVSWSSGLKIAMGANNVTLRGNFVSENWGEGIAITRGVNISVVSNVVVDNYSANIYVDNSVNVDVIRNMIYCTENPSVKRQGRIADGIATAEEYYQGWGNRLANLRVLNNIVHSCLRGFSYSRTKSSFAGSGGLRNTIVGQNTFYNIKRVGVFVNEAEETLLWFQNNLIDAAGDFAYFEDLNGGGPQGVMADYNFWANGKPPFWENANGPNDVNNYDPIFVNGVPDFNVDSFRLAENSPAVDGGKYYSQVGPWHYDMQGNSRVPTGPNTAPDMGAHELSLEGNNWFDAQFVLPLD